MWTVKSGTGGWAKAPPTFQAKFDLIRQSKRPTLSAEQLAGSWWIWRAHHKPCQLPEPHESCFRIFKFKTGKKNDPFWYHRGPKTSSGLGFSFQYSVCGWSPPPASPSLQCLEDEEHQGYPWECFGQVMMKKTMMAPGEGFFHVCQRQRCWACEQVENSPDNLVKKRKFDRLWGKVS